MPIPLHLTGDGDVEAFEEVAIEVNLTKGNGSVVAEIAHFSWAYYPRYFEARLEGVESGYLVGERFTASASIGLKDPPPFSGRLPREEQTLHLNGDFLAWGA